MAQADLIEQWFETMFHDDVTHKFQQMSSMLMEKAFTVRNVVGSTVNFPILDRTTLTKNKPAHLDIEADTGGHTDTEVTLANYTGGRYISKLDELKQSPNIRDKYTENLSFAGGRELDQIILDALDAGITASDNEETTAGALTFARLVVMAKYQRQKSVFGAAGKKTLVVDEEGWEDLAVDTTLVNSDFVSYRVAMDGEVPVVLGYEVVVVEPQLIPNRTISASGDASFAYGFHENALGVAVGQDVMTGIDWIGQKNSFLTWICLSAGAKAILPEGVYRLNVNGS